MESSNLDIHRRLDEAFAGIDMTPDIQDLKEEMRADLLVRVSELEGRGLSGPEAARRAMAELGDIGHVVEELRAVRPAPAPPRVRPRPAFVVRTVVLAILGLGALASVVLIILADGRPTAGLVAAGGLLAVLAGGIVADALRQETTTSFPLPARRAVGFGVATALAVAGAVAAARAVADPELPWLVVTAVGALTSVVLFTYLGATQTNRHKPWVLRRNAEHAALADRFSTDPAAAARFGVYTVTIWIGALAAFVALSLTVGFVWSWLALVGGLVAFLVTLARMLFVPPA